EGPPMTRFVVLICALLLAAAAPAFAAGPLNPTTIEADAPTTNADGSPLTDFKALGFCVASSTTAPPLSCVEVNSATPSPTGVVTMSSPVAAWNLTTDGQY